MSKCVLGIHNGHNASAALLQNGKLRFAQQEERFTRIKNQGDMPARTLAYIAANLLDGNEKQSLSAVFGGQNLTKGAWRREDILRSAGLPGPGASGQVKRLLRKNGHLSAMLNERKMRGLEQELKRITAIGGLAAGGIDHHLCHAASAYYGWGKMQDKILILTCDGAGDTICASVNIGEKGEIRRIDQVDESHSIGALYSKITYLFGMVPLEHEYKLMGLAPYAERSSNAESVASQLETLLAFESHRPLRWARRNGCPPLQFSAEYLSQMTRRTRFDHMAAGLQLFVERFLTRWVRNCIRETGTGKVALSGGVFMNVKLNQRILELPEVEDLFIFPSCGDETNAIGSAWYFHHQTFQEAPEPLGAFYLGISTTNDKVEEAIKSYRFQRPVLVQESDDIELETASLLNRGEIVARFQGRAEFGARSLGNRSILANAGSTNAVRIINEMIKCRDFWMPFAPSVLAERSDDYFRKPKGMKAPYMIVTFDTHEEKRAAIPAAIHPYDFTGRPQEVDERFNPSYHRLLKYFEDMTGEGLILNTSFNLHGEPIVSSPEDALRVFEVSGLKHLAIGNFMLSKDGASAIHRTHASAHPARQTNPDFELANRVSAD